MRENEFQRYHISAFDIETYKQTKMSVNNNNMQFGNMIPFMLSFYGDVYSFSRGESVKVSKVFVGLDCCEEFIDYLIDQGFFSQESMTIDDVISGVVS